MKMYLVDFSPLPAEEREEAFHRLDRAAWDTFPTESPTVFKVAWDSKEDFLSSPAFPTGCICREYGG